MSAHGVGCRPLAVTVLSANRSTANFLVSGGMRSFGATSRWIVRKVSPWMCMAWPKYSSLSRVYLDHLRLEAVLAAPESYPGNHRRRNSRLFSGILPCWRAETKLFICSPMAPNWALKLSGTPVVRISLLTPPGLLSTYSISNTAKRLPHSLTA